MPFQGHGCQLLVDKKPHCWGRAVWRKALEKAVKKPKMMKVLGKHHNVWESIVIRERGRRKGKDRFCEFRQGDLYVPEVDKTLLIDLICYYY